MTADGLLIATDRTAAAANRVLSGPARLPDTDIVAFTPAPVRKGAERLSKAVAALGEAQAAQRDHPTREQAKLDAARVEDAVAFLADHHDRAELLDVGVERARLGLVEAQTAFDGAIERHADEIVRAGREAIIAHRKVAAAGLAAVRGELTKIATAWRAVSYGKTRGRSKSPGTGWQKVTVRGHDLSASRLLDALAEIVGKG